MYLGFTHAAMYNAVVGVKGPLRQDGAQEEHGLGFCIITKCCKEVCPEHIKITDNALVPMKERVVDRKYDPLVRLGNKIRRRPERSSTTN